MNVTNVTADAESFTCNAYLAEGDRTVLVDAGAMDGVVDLSEVGVAGERLRVGRHVSDVHTGRSGAALFTVAAPGGPALEGPPGSIQIRIEESGKPSTLSTSARGPEAREQKSRAPRAFWIP